MINRLGHPLLADQAQNIAAMQSNGMRGWGMGAPSFEGNAGCYGGYGFAPGGLGYSQHSLARACGIKPEGPKQKPRLICKGCKGKDFILRPKRPPQSIRAISIADCRCCGSSISLNARERSLLFGETQ